MTQYHDTLTRFLFDEHDVRGEIVNLYETYHAILSAQNYPPAVQILLGELLVSTALLTATLKFEGDITVQLQGDGPVSLAVINGDHLQHMRGVARFEGDIPNDATLHQLIGEGIMVITITPTQGERYQGIVALEGETLADCLEAYFKQSEQLATKLILNVGVMEHQPIAAGLLLQTLPSTREETADSFDHFSILAATIKPIELFSLPPQDLLYRLYHEEAVRLFKSQPIEFRCRCSRQRCEEALMTLPESEIHLMITEDETIDMHCDYCGSHYIFDEIDIEKLLKEHLKETTH